MMRPPFFSIVIPTHNRVAMVQRALRSVAAQTFRNFEVVVVDDGCTDATPAFLETVRSSRCRVLRHERGLGVSAARNRGVAASTGQFITFLDDDDELRPYALEALHDRYQSNPQLDFLWGGRLIHEMDATERNIGTREDDWRGLPATVSGASFLNLVLEIATNSAFTIRRTVFDAVGGFDERLRKSEDRDLFIALARTGHTGAAVPRSIIDVNEHGTSLSRGSGRRVGPEIDLSVIDKHRQYLNLPEHRQFLDSYFVAVYEGFLEADNRGSAVRILGELRRRRALSVGLLRKYIRHAPEFRALKALIRYDTIRRLKNNLRKARAP
jgi:glycosyltransferase involved in cell wall biosynthesis